MVKRCTPTTNSFVSQGLHEVHNILDLLVVALQFDAVYDVFEQRARVVQEYDGAQLGRFARHMIGFQWAKEMGGFGKDA